MISQLENCLTIYVRNVVYTFYNYYTFKKWTNFVHGTNRTLPGVLAYSKFHV